MKQSTQMQRVENAKLGIIIDEPGFGMIAMHLPLIEDVSVPTFRTNGKWVKFNPTHAETLTVQEIKGVLVHEYEHVALLHPWRQGGRNNRRWNVACDYAINNYLASYIEESRKVKREPTFKLPSSMLLDPQYNNMSAEQIYTKLPPEPEENPTPEEQEQGDAGEEEKQDTEEGGGNGDSDPNAKGEDAPSDGEGDDQQGGEGGAADPSQSSSVGEVEPAPGDESEREESEQEMRGVLIAAAETAIAQGTAPGFFRRYIKELTTPKVPWQEVLREYMVKVSKEDVSYARPNRRYSHLAMGEDQVIMPGSHCPTLGRVAIAVDTSGSIIGRAADFFGEVQDVFNGCSPESLVLIQCDAKVTDVTEMEASDDFPKIEAKGGGGTDFRPVFNCIGDMEEPPAVLVFLTDLYGTFPEREPDYPVIWVTVNDVKAPFGVTIKMD